MLYSIIRFILRWWIIAFRRMEVLGSQNIPQDGPIVVASNHISYLDPVAVATAMDRRVFFMAKAELFRIPIFGSLLKALGAFPVNRSVTDRTAIKIALTHLKSGRVIGIFPEGTRSRSGKTLPPHVGVAVLALRCNAPVLPVGVTGTKGYTSKVRVNFGKLIYPSDFSKDISKLSKEDYVVFSEQIMEEIVRLL